MTKLVIHINIKIIKRRRNKIFIGTAYDEIINLFNIGNIKIYTFVNIFKRF